MHRDHGEAKGRSTAEPSERRTGEYSAMPNTGWTGNAEGRFPFKVDVMSLSSMGLRYRLELMRAPGAETMLLPILARAQP
jgi:hypothetical protein